MAEGQTFFDFAAEVGLTKHVGGLDTTGVLLELCHISRDKYVLDVGCGAGVTPIFIAKKYGAKVVGVDINNGMVARSTERAVREQVADRVEIRQADAQDLPFEDETFDIVITESVTAFPADKQQAVNEYVRVTKPGGYIGLNESTWLKTPPPPEMVAWVSQDLGGNAEPLASSEWVDLLEVAGLVEIESKIYEIDVRDEFRGFFRRYGCGGMLGIYARILLLYIKNPAYRQFVKEIRKGGLTPDNLDEYFGYGLYVGQK
jgi:SAM-dependent methyltransferase